MKTNQVCIEGIRSFMGYKQMFVQRKGEADEPGSQGRNMV